jgi:UDP-N-acetyl-D-glucosamine dehydrogenase
MEMKKPIGVIGLGYVGLPLCIHFARSGARVIGFDVDAEKVTKLNAEQSYILHIPAEQIHEAKEAGGFEATVDFAQIADCGAVIICVPTPLGRHREPDIRFILKTGEAIAPHLQPGSVVILESTTYPGTTDTDLRKVLEEGSGLKAGVDFYLAYSPEREDPGRKDRNVTQIPKVIGGFTPECLAKATAVYECVIDELIPVSSCRVAEAVKLTENIFRAVNIAMINELKVVYEAMGIDIWDVIDAAKSKPFGFMPFYPGPGLGGHCIPIDPFYLTWKAREYGQPTKFIELAGEINTSMPAYVMKHVSDALSSDDKPLKGSRILLLGIAYKANVDDDRESPAYVLWRLLEDQGATVDYHDPHVPVIRPSREHSRFAGRKNIELNETRVSQYDLILVTTKHDAVDYAMIARNANLIVDTRNAFKGFIENSEKYFKA